MSETEEIIGENSFKFYDINRFYLPPDENQHEYQKPFCQLDVKVTLKTYEDGRMFYYIDYEWSYLHWLKDKYGSNLIKHADLIKNPKKYDPEHSLPVMSLNPFFRDKNQMEDHMDGEIIVKNSLSDQLVKYLLMDFDDLESHSGSVVPDNYKISVIKSISFFWD